ncbi:TapA domain-containing protein [Achromobacter sp. RTa]|uniref:DUF3613 domain-containing protein n=1 Tax=Achromobacter sp. RTa TaxID=1532557 RepID=UPI00050DA827|nr:DUF3613 domain-containing protein [Achromobacter sp. RTa]KGD89385.1 TapA domain-containing protein [Achromobacter sp. RTa]
MSLTRFFASFSLAAAFAGLAAPASHAQSNAPLTGGMSGGNAAPTAPAPAPTALPERPVVQQVSTPMPAEAPAAPQASQAAAPEGFGDVTRGLLAAQADGRRAGGALPILGPVSTAAWNRYLDSFKHPIPEWMQKRVETKNTR